MPNPGLAHLLVTLRLPYHLTKLSLFHESKVVITRGVSGIIDHS